MKKGDKVKLTKEALESKVLVPTRLVRNGHPNIFTVADMSHTIKGWIPLEECCNGGEYCTGHPIINFIVIGVSLV